MSSANDQQRLASLRKEYGSHYGRWNLSDVLADDNCSNNKRGVLDALLHQGSFASGKVPDAFESVKTTGSGKVICDEILCNFESKLLYNFEKVNKITLEFTSNSEGRLCKMVEKCTYFLKEESDTPEPYPRCSLAAGVSVILKRTPVYLLQKNEDSTLVKFMTDYYHWVWCLSEKGINQEQVQALGKKRKKCASRLADQEEQEHGPGLPKVLVLRIAEFVGPAPVMWLEEGDILITTLYGHQFLSRPRKGPH